MLVYFKPGILEFYPKKAGTTLELKLGPEIIQNQEVLDLPLLEKKVKEFLDTANLSKEEVIVCLSPDLTFQKVLPLTDAGDEKFETDKFLGNIPFESPNIEVRTVKSETDLSLFAANKHLFYPVVRILEKYDWVVSAVVPVAAFAQGKELSSSEMEVVYTDDKVRSAVNFLASKEPDEEDLASAFVLPTRALILGAVFLLALLILGIVLVVGQKKSNTGPKEVPLTKVPAVQTTTASPSAYKAKADLKVQVLNGSGTAGDAAKVVAVLERLGYQNLQTGNLDVQNATATVINVNKSVSPDIYSELSLTLSKLFSKVASSSASPSASFDITIITGK